MEDLKNYNEKDNLKAYIDKFLYYEEVVIGKSYNTIKSYKKDIMQFIDYLNEYEEIKDFEEVETMTFRSFIAYLNSGDKENSKNNIQKSVSKRSINRKISALRTFFKYLQEKKIVKTNKVAYITMPKFEKELPNVLNKEDINK